MWSESGFRNAGISRASYCLLEQLTCRNPKDSFEAFTHRGFQVAADWQDRENLRVSPLSPSTRGRKALWETFGTGRLARSGRFDVWLATAHSVPFRSRIPTVTFIHDMIPLSHPEFQDRAQSAYLRFALKSAARRADRVLTNSETTKSEIVRYAQVAEEKVVVLPLGPGFKIEAECGPEPATPFDRYLFALGTLEPRKNIAVVFEAFARLKQRGRLGELGLVVAGGRGWKEEGIFDRLKQLGIESRVAFLGYVPDERLTGLFRECEAFIFPSLFEGFGMPIVEAMACGTRVLTSGRGAMKEVAGNAAIVFDPESAEDVARAIEEALEEPSDARSARIALGRSRASEFTWEAAADATMAVLRSLVK
jgi:glycosyltransferase involved in cell wall biosynthesis